MWTEGVFREERVQERAGLTEKVEVSQTASGPQTNQPTTRCPDLLSSADTSS